MPFILMIPSRTFSKLSLLISKRFLSNKWWEYDPLFCERNKNQTDMIMTTSNNHVYALNTYSFESSKASYVRGFWLTIHVSIEIRPKGQQENLHINCRRGFNINLVFQEDGMLRFCTITQNSWLDFSKALKSDKN